MKKNKQSFKGIKLCLFYFYKRVMNLKKEVMLISLVIFSLISLGTFIKSYFFIPGDVLYSDLKDGMKMTVLLGMIILGILYKMRFKKMFWVSVCIFLSIYVLSLFQYEYISDKKIVVNSLFKMETVKIKEIKKIEIYEKKRENVFIIEDKSNKKISITLKDKDKKKILKMVSKKNKDAEVKEVFKK